jgi:N utilization substance protein B
MLNRRHLRIKAFQTVYAYQQAELKDRKSFEKILLDSVLSVHHAYIQSLALLVELSEFEEMDVADRSSKHLPSDDDLNAKAVLSHNLFVQNLKNDQDFLSLVKKYKLSWSDEQVLLREIFNKIKADEAYKEYSKLSERTVSQERDCITHLFKAIFFVDPLLEQYFEEKYINWPVDKQSVDGMVLKTLRAFKDDASEKVDILPITANWEEDEEFVKSLFNKTILYADDYGKMIAEKTQNWEVDRIALVDVILMKMAIAELIHFNSIPTKVSMNEYIDISKEFSTPKSKGFINGILDKILIELKEKGEIRKIGRGLME